MITKSNFTLHPYRRKLKLPMKFPQILLVRRERKPSTLHDKKFGCAQVTYIVIYILNYGSPVQLQKDCQQVTNKNTIN